MVLQVPVSMAEPGIEENTPLETAAMGAYRYLKAGV
jgi:hypothetical protein